jgi:hypothetical protein
VLPRKRARDEESERAGAPKTYRGRSGSIAPSEPSRRSRRIDPQGTPVVQCEANVKMIQTATPSASELRMRHYPHFRSRFPDTRKMTWNAPQDAQKSGGTRPKGRPAGEGRNERLLRIIEVLQHKDRRIVRNRDVTGVERLSKQNGHRRDIDFPSHESSRRGGLPASGKHLIVRQFTQQPSSSELLLPYSPLHQLERSARKHAPAIRRCQQPNIRCNCRF